MAKLEILGICYLIYVVAAGSKKPIKAQNQTEADAGNMVMQEGTLERLQDFLDTLDKRVVDAKERLDQPDEAGNMEMDDGRYTYDKGDSLGPDAGNLFNVDNNNKEIMKEVYDGIEVLSNILHRVKNGAEELSDIGQKAYETAKQNHEP